MLKLHGVTTLWGYSNQVVFAMIYNNSVVKHWGKDIFSKAASVQIYKGSHFLQGGIMWSSGANAGTFKTLQNEFY